MGAHFTNHSPQLGVLVLAGLIVNTDQSVFDGLRHDWVRPPSLLRIVGRNDGILRKNSSFQVHVGGVGVGLKSHNLIASFS
jgi:hypothetical protein